MNTAQHPIPMTEHSRGQSLYNYGKPRIREQYFPNRHNRGNITAQTLNVQESKHRLGMCKKQSTDSGRANIEVQTSNVPINAKTLDVQKLKHGLRFCKHQSRGIAEQCAIGHIACLS
jgi:hypothetical protein